MIGRVGQDGIDRVLRPKREQWLLRSEVARLVSQKQEGQIELPYEASQMCGHSDPSSSSYAQVEICFL